MAKYFLNNTKKLLVFDMAGTIVKEYGLVYKTLHETLNTFNMNVTEDEIKNMAGANKHEVINHYVAQYSKHPVNNSTLNSIIIDKFETNLKYKYQNKDAISLIDPELKTHFENIRLSGYKIGLNTGYSRDLQSIIINNLELQNSIDACISSEDVSSGRPYPFMIFNLMNQLNIKNSDEVVKIGDTVNDILEGLNAKCDTIGVLTGANNEDELFKAGANYVLDSVMDIEVLNH